MSNIEPLQLKNYSERQGWNSEITAAMVFVSTNSTRPLQLQQQKPWKRESGTLITGRKSCVHKTLQGTHLLKGQNL